MTRGPVLPPDPLLDPARNQSSDWTRYLAYALPVTHGIGLLQELMLRGDIRDAWMLGALAAIGLVLYVGSLLRVRRVLRTAD